MSLKVVAVTDKVDTAIDRLARGMSRYHVNLDYVVCDVHPKKPSPEQLHAFEEAARNADIIDWQYFRTAELLRTRYPWLSEKKQILMHHNPYSITESDWNNYDMVVANNKTIYKNLGEITSAPLEYIGNTVDTDFWTYNVDWEPGQRVLMVANRIEGKKGILPLAIACGDAGLHLDLVGAVSNPQYLYDILQTGAVTFHERISDSALRDLYHKATIYAFNSVDNYESSGQPLLEAMITGVPVLTRRIGIVPELDNGENMVIHEGDPEDVPALTNLLTDMVNDKKALGELRDKAWQTAKTRAHERRAYLFQRLYRQVLHGIQRPVTVVVPIYDKQEVIRKCLDAVARQTYKNIELIVPDDSLGGRNRKLVEEFAQYVSFPVRYMNTSHWTIDAAHPDGHEDYGLARARNMATIEATGEIMVYCDQRQTMEPDCVEEFVANVKPRYWLSGNKGANKQTFIENLSCLYRRDMLRFGGFSERGEWYGYQSQYCREVAKAQALKTEYCETARAIPVGKSSNRNRKREEIILSKNQLFKMFEAQDN